MGKKSFKTIVHEKMVLKLIEEIERLKKERDNLKLEIMRLTNLYLTEKRERKKLEKERKEVNGLVGAVNYDAPNKIRELIKLLYEYEGKARNLEEKLKVKENAKLRCI